MPTRTRVALIGVAAMLATAWTGWAQAQDINVSYYTPQFYMDYLVFYDEAGTPIYYEDDQAYAVPEDYPEYNDLVSQFEANEDAYFQWFDEVGYANLQYRRTPVVDYYKPRYYQGHPVFFKNDQPVYYLDGQVHVIAPADPRYARLIAHYQQHRDAYRRWYRSVGRHYRWYVRPIFTGYYRPLYYQGYLLFFDDSGMPYYYHNGRMVYVPRSHREFAGYVSHYRAHRDNYRRWYKERGHKHHAYREAKHYRERRVAPRAPKASHGRAEVRKYRRDKRPGLRPADHRPPPRNDRPGLQPVPERRDRPGLQPVPERRDRPGLQPVPEHRDRPGLKPVQPDPRDRRKERREERREKRREKRRDDRH